MIFTIGHSTRETSEFIALLKEHGINVIIDVRSVPKSWFVPQYNKENIEKTLSKNGVIYVFLGDKLGARDWINVLDEDSIDTLKEIEKSKPFKEGIEKILELEKKHKKVCIMCSEKNPVDCHRGLIISKILYRKNAKILHIIDKDIKQSQRDIEDILYMELVKKIFKKHKNKSMGVFV